MNFRLKMLTTGLLLLGLGCATSTLAAWTPCPDRMKLSGGIERGTVNGSDLAKLVQGGEADSVDSNYEGYRIDIGFEAALGTPPSRCPTLGGREGE